MSAVMLPLFIYQAAVKTPAQKVCETKAVFFRDPIKADVCYGLSVVPISCDQVKDKLEDYTSPKN